MTTSIASIGVDLATDDVAELEYTDRASLLDYDVVLIRPSIPAVVSQDADYNGHPSYDDNSSALLKSADRHWTTEIKLAVEAGRTVIVFMSDIHECWVGTGQTTQTGTGRLAQRRRIVAPHHNFKFLPMAIEPRGTSGSAMRLADKGGEFLASYWQEFGRLSSYRVVLPEHDSMRACVLTRSGNYVVGGAIRSKVGGGTLLLLPDLDFSPEHFSEEIDGEWEWTDDARKFAARLLSAIVALHKTLRGEGAATPKPAWANDAAYSLPNEGALREELRLIGERLQEVQSEQLAASEKLKEAGVLRDLLFENGKRLEMAVIRALTILGFSAVPFKDANSEFDVVFECAEGRLIGEVEGKDSKAINVDKLRQLAMNIQEDLMREEVSSPAKGVLFGNGFRLMPPEERADQFTAKCLTAGAAGSFALVPTTALFQVAAELLAHPDESFAKDCREALLSGVGLVRFPAKARDDAGISGPLAGVS